MIIAVDYDGTLFRDKAINAVLVARLQAEQRRGNIIILWTVREGKSLFDALGQLAEQGFYPNYVNQNVPAVVKAFGHDSRKVYADLYIDDKAVKP